MPRLFPSGLALLTGILAVAWSSALFASEPTPADCAAESDRASRDEGTAIGGIAKGAARGSISGATLGDGKSARRGAALGSIVGGVRRGAKGELVDMTRYLCKDVMRMYDNDRAVTIGLLHGYVLGKKNATSFVADHLSELSNQFIECCLDNPNEKAMASFEKTLPDGRRFANAEFTKSSTTPEADRDRAIAEVTRALYDF